MNKSIYKQAKFGDLPGDISKSKKIKMLEGENTPCAKLYRKDFHKKANKKFRHEGIKNVT